MISSLDELRGNVRRSARVILIGFLLIAFTLGYWQVFRATDLATDASNPRAAEARLFAPRGKIVDRQGNVLAQSESTPEGMRRRYAEPSLVHTTGFFSPRFGATNVESAFDAQLRGARSADPMDRLLSELLNRSVQVNDVALTVDKRIHDSAIAALGNQRGAIVALDPKTGAVLALASTPFFDPNQSDEQLAQVQNREDRPLINRAVQSLYVPGSTFKAVTASVAVDSNLVDLDQKFSCTTAIRIGTYAIDCKNSQHVPNLTFKEGFAWSSNRVFGLAGLLLGFPGPMNPWLADTPPGDYPWTRQGANVSASASKLEDYAQRFGFKREIPFEMPITPSEVKNSGSEWTPQLLAQTAFGQGELNATPMQMALIAAAIANEGKVPTPYLVESVKAPGGATVHPHQPGSTFSQAMSSASAKTMVDFMVEGVDRGYGAKAAIPNVKVGGKTGTAEIGDGESHSWFIGFAPAEDPRIAIAVIVERGGSGSDVATPMAQRVMRTALDVYKR